MNLHSCWISLSKSTGPAVAQHLIAEVGFPFPICFHFHQKIEINFVVRVLMVSATIYMITSFLILGLLVHVTPSIFFSRILRSGCEKRSLMFEGSAFV